MSANSKSAVTPLVSAGQRRDVGDASTSTTNSSSSFLLDTAKRAASVANSISSPAAASANAAAPGNSASATHGATKRIIRSVTVLDAKKLQQAGLDRKLAEALSKQKHQQQQTSTASTVTKETVVTTTTATNSSMTQAANVAATKQATTVKKITPPTITITRPVDSPTELKSAATAELLASAQRMAHVKSLLQNKLLMKKAELAADASATATVNEAATNPRAAVAPHLKDALTKSNEQKSYVAFKTSGVKQKPTVSSTLQRVKKVLDFCSNNSDSRPTFPKVENTRKEPPRIINYSLSKHDSVLAHLGSRKSQNETEATFAKTNVTTSDSCPTHIESFENLGGTAAEDIPKASIRSKSVVERQNTNLRYAISHTNPSKQLPMSAVAKKHTLESDLSTLRPTAPATVPPLYRPNKGSVNAAANFPVKLEVLENKVLSQSEKIDLNDLRLLQCKTEPLTPVKAELPYKPTIFIQSASDTLPIAVTPPVMQRENAVSLRQSANIATTTATKAAKQTMKVILPVDKLKLAPEKIAALARKIQKDAQSKSVKQIGTISKAASEQLVPAKRQPISSNHEEDVVKQRVGKPTNKFLVQATAEEPPKAMKTLKIPVETTTIQHKNAAMADDVNYCRTLATDKTAQTTHLSNSSTSSIAAAQVVPVKLTKSIQYPVPVIDNVIIQNTNAVIQNKVSFWRTLCVDDKAIIVQRKSNETNKKLPDSVELSAEKAKPSKHFKAPPMLPRSARRSAVEIVREPSNNNAASAVDFITSLACANPITEDTTLELSADELNLNASFAMNLSPIRLPSSPPREAYKRRTDSESSTFGRPCAADMLADVFTTNTSLEIGNIITVEEQHVLNVTKDADEQTNLIITPEKVKMETVMHVIGDNKTVFQEAMLKQQLVDDANMEEKDNEVVDKAAEMPISIILDNNKEIKSEAKNTPKKKTAVEAVATEQKLELENAATKDIGNVFKEVTAATEASLQVPKTAVSPTKDTAIAAESTEMSDRPGKSPIKSDNAAAKKRVSRFKKGIINLVPRKKTTTASETAKSDAIVTATATSKEENDMKTKEHGARDTKEAVRKATKEEAQQEIKDMEAEEEARSEAKEEVRREIIEKADKQTKEITVDAHKHTKEEGGANTKKEASRKIKQLSQEMQNGAISPVKSSELVEVPTVNNFDSDSPLKQSLPANDSNNKTEQSKLPNAQLQTETGALQPTSIRPPVEAKEQCLKEAQLPFKRRPTIITKLIEKPKGIKNLLQKLDEGKYAPPEKDVNVVEKEAKICNDDNEKNVEVTSKMTERHSDYADVEELKESPKAATTTSHVLAATEHQASVVTNDAKNVKEKNNAANKIQDSTSITRTDSTAANTKQNSKELHAGTHKSSVENAVEAAKDTKSKTSKEKQQRETEEPSKTASFSKQPKRDQAVSKTCEQRNKVDTSDNRKETAVKETKLDAAQAETKLTRIKEETSKESIVEVTNKGSVTKSATSKISIQTSSSEEEKLDLAISLAQNKAATQHEIQEAQKKKETAARRRSLGRSLVRAVEDKPKDVHEAESSNEKSSIASKTTAKVMKSPKKIVHASEKEFLSETEKPTDMLVCPKAESSPVKSLKFSTAVTLLPEVSAISAMSVESEDETAKESSSQEMSVTKNRKRLRKTMENSKKTKVAASEVSDSDDDRPDDSIDFSGFNETSPTNSKMQNSFELLKQATSGEDGEDEYAVTSSTQLEKSISPNSGTLKNWLTTGKAISPTLKCKKPSRKATAGRVTLSRSMPLKKRWELAQQPYEETDITDDTSPADDEDAQSNKAERAGLRKRSLADAIETVQQIIASKTMKLSEVAAAEKISDKPVQGFSAPLPVAASNETTASALETTVTAEKSSAKKRGRKPKLQKSAAVADQLETANYAEQATSLNKAIVAASRTVCVKIEKTKDTENLATPTTQIAAIAPSVVEDPDFENKSLLHSISSSSPAAVVNIPKKRGRKPKRLLQEDTATANNVVVKNEPCLEEATPPPAKRARTQNENSTADASATPEASTSAEADAVSETTTPLVEKKKRGRKPKPKIIGEEKADAVSETTTPLVEKKKRGRKPKPKVIGEENGVIKTVVEPKVYEPFDPRLLLITERKQLETEEPLTLSDEAAGVGPIQCGLCLARLVRKNWIQHLAEHYGVGWIVGEPEICLTTRNSVINAIVYYYKNYVVGKGLKCRMCQREYRSGLGLLLHIELCGAAPARIVCGYCNNDYTKLSLPNHQRACAIRWQQQKEAKEKKLAVKEAEKVYSNSGRLKRASLMKAEKKLKTIGADQVGVVDPKNHIECQAPAAITDDVRQQWQHELENRQKICCLYQPCIFEATDVSTLEAHLSNCEHEPKASYACLLCDAAAKEAAIFPTEEEALEHVKDTHKSSKDFKANDNSSDAGVYDGMSTSDDDGSSGVDSDEDTDAKSSVRSKLTKGAHHATTHKQLFGMRSEDLRKDVLNKWKEFTRQNYVEEWLFACALPTYKALDASAEELSRYLPSHSVSMKCALSTRTKLPAILGAAETVEWSELKRFEHTAKKDVNLTFVGSPIKTLAWAPLPAHVQEQYLLVAYRKDFEKYTRLRNPHLHTTLLLLYKVTRTTDALQSQLQYAIRIPQGPVHCIAFLPSGGYAAETNRLGLVAVGTAVSAINIYALPIDVENVGNSVEGLHVIDLAPAFVLTLDMTTISNESAQWLTDAQCLQISWSETLSHQHIFASFSNGFVGVWDVELNENLNLFMLNDVCHFVPLHFFYTGENIRLMDIHYDTTGVRWLVVIGPSRDFKVYDIQDLTHPVLLKQDTCKNIARSLHWSPVWESFVFGLCDSAASYNRCLVGVNAVGVPQQNNRIATTLGAITQTHYSPLLNVHVCGSENGDLTFLNTHELHFTQSSRNLPKRFHAISLLDVKCLSGAALPTYRSHKNLPENWQMHEPDYKQKYGLVFGPLQKFREAKEKKNPYCSEKRIPTINLVRHMRINGLRCNWNVHGRQMVAVGYENGFLRVLEFSRKDYF